MIRIESSPVSTPRHAELLNQLLPAQIFPKGQKITGNVTGIEAANLDERELRDLASKTAIFITTVGPYSRYGEHAFKACAENGTHYLDVTGEPPFVARMIKKYEHTAKATGAIMIPQIGLESAPSDLVTWSLVSLIRRELSAPTGEVVLSVHDLQ